MPDQLTNDLDAQLAAEAVLDAVNGNAKRAGIAADRTERTGRRWTSGDRSNPLYRLRKLIEGSPNRWIIVADVIGMAVRADLGDEGFMPEWRWRHLMREACREEQERDGEEDAVTQLWLQGEASLADLRTADSRHAAPKLQRIGLAEIGQRRGYTLTGGGRG